MKPRKPRQHHQVSHNASLSKEESETSPVPETAGSKKRKRTQVSNTSKGHTIAKDKGKKRQKTDVDNQASQNHHDVSAQSLVQQVMCSNVCQRVLTLT